MEKYCNVIQVRWCVIVHNHKDSTGAERVMQVTLDTEIGHLETAGNAWFQIWLMIRLLQWCQSLNCVLSECLCACCPMNICTSSMDELCTMVDLWLSRLTHQPYFTCCLSQICTPRYVQFSSIFQTGQRMTKHTVISMCPCTYIELFSTSEMSN